MSRGHEGHGVNGGVDPLARLVRVGGAAQHQRPRALAHRPARLSGGGVQNYALDAACQIHGGYDDRLQFATGQHDLGQLQGAEGRDLVGGDGEGRAAEIPEGGHPAGHNIADEADVLVDLGLRVQGVFQQNLKLGPLGVTQIDPDLRQQTRQLPGQILPPA